MNEIKGVIIQIDLLCRKQANLYISFYFQNAVKRWYTKNFLYAICEIELLSLMNVIYV